MRARTSSNSRTFSIAITAWSAKFCTSSICLSVNGLNLLAVNVDSADQFVLLEHRDDEDRPGRPDVGKSHDRGITFKIWRLRLQVFDLHHASCRDDFGMRAFWMGPVHMVPPFLHIFGRHVVQRGVPKDLAIIEV